MTANSKNPLFVWGIFLAVFITLLGYCLPWLTNPGMSLSLNAYDLAEWTSLNPLVRSTNPMLLLTLLLRIPLPCLALTVACLIRHPVLRLFTVGVVALALLPPLEFFTNAGTDPNYQQQFALAIASVILGLLTFTRLFQKVRWLIAIGYLVLGSLGSLVGVLQALQLMEGFKLPVHIGSGAIVTLIGLLTLTAYAITNWNKEKAG